MTVRDALPRKHATGRSASTFRSREASSPHLSKGARRRDTDDMKPDDSKSSSGERPSYPPGRQPYDKLVGMRVGALVGGLIGGLGAFLLGGIFAWLIVIGAVLGGVIGHRMGES